MLVGLVVRGMLVVDGFRRLENGQSLSGLQHADLWEQVEHAWRVKGGMDFFKIAKAMAHAKAEHVAQGLTTEQERAWNNGADGLAVDGALEHCLPLSVLARAARRRRVAWYLQSMMINIWAARMRAERALEEEARRSGELLVARCHQAGEASGGGDAHINMGSGQVRPGPPPEEYMEGGDVDEFDGVFGGEDDDEPTRI